MVLELLNGGLLKSINQDIPEQNRGDVVTAVHTSTVGAVKSQPSLYQGKMLPTRPSIEE